MRSRLPPAQASPLARRTCFSTHTRTFAGGLKYDYPEGTYGFVTDDLGGPYRPLGGTGLVFVLRRPGVRRTGCRCHPHQRRPGRDQPGGGAGVLAVGGDTDRLFDLNGMAI